MNYICWQSLLLLMCTGVTTAFFIFNTRDQYPGIGDRAHCDFGGFFWTGIILDIVIDASVSYHVRHINTAAVYSMHVSQCKCYDWDTICGSELAPPVCDDIDEALYINGRGWVTSINECRLRERDGLRNEGQRCWDECDSAGVCVSSKCISRKLTFAFFEKGFEFGPQLACTSEEKIEYCGTGVCCRYGSKWDANKQTTATSLQECANKRIGGVYHHRCVAALTDKVINNNNKSPCVCKKMEHGWYQLNDIAKECPACQPGHERQDCKLSDVGWCRRCVEGRFSIDGKGPCLACETPENPLYKECSQEMGYALVGCGGTSAGKCVKCPVGKFKNTAGGECKSCTTEFEQSCQAASCPDKTTFPEKSHTTSDKMNVRDECHVLQGCGGSTAGTCRCYKGYYTTDTEVNKNKVCTLCPDGTYKPEVSTETECHRCGHLNTNSDVPRTSFENCNCRNTQNHIEKPASNNLNNLECVFCLYEEPVGSKPFKLKGTNECTECPKEMYFDMTDKNHPNQNCTDIPIMKIVCKPGNFWAIEPLRDSYRIIQSFITEVPDNYYLDIATYIVMPCDLLCANSYEYAQGCGGVQDHSIWISDNTTNTNFKVNLITHMAHANTDCDEQDKSKQIQREGNCEPCTACGPNYYNSACKPGPGTCQRCKTLSDCGTGKFYLTHELDNGCDDAHAVKDYDCMSCEPVKENAQGFWIMQACGNNVFTRWKDDNTTNDKPNSLTCENSGSDPSCDVFDGGTRRTQWNSSGTPLPYCPPGWYVLKTCFEQHLEEWHPDCCERCENYNLFPERKKTPEWAECTGQSHVDTQRTVERCEDNYFEDADECKLCEMCTAV